MANVISLARAGCLVATALTATALIPARNAAANPITEDFVFTDSGATQATGSFTYDSSAAGTITYADLSAFSLTITATGNTYDLAFVNSATDYIYFAFDPTTKSFVPGFISSGFGGPYESLLSAINSNGSNGFFFDPFTSMNVPDNDGEYTDYAAGYDGFADAVTFRTVPEPASLAALLIGLTAVGYVRRRRAV